MKKIIICIFAVSLLASCTNENKENYTENDMLEEKEMKAQEIADKIEAMKDEEKVIIKEEIKEDTVKKEEDKAETEDKVEAKDEEDTETEDDDKEVEKDNENSNEESEEKDEKTESETKTISLEEVALHKTNNDCYTAID